MSHVSDVNKKIEKLERELMHVGSDKPLVHQWTLNGYTYPFVLCTNVAALPHPKPSPIERGPADARDTRRHDMLSSALVAKPGDLLIFFQADPQRSSPESLRGLVGVYRVVGDLYSSNQDLVLNTPSNFKLPVETSPYLLHGVCPLCNTPYSNLKQCGQGHDLPVNGDCPEYILNLRLNVEPEILFKFPVPDESVYADFLSLGNCLADTLVWTGRHDNAMGAGKGSSVRILLPEEALRILRLLANFPGQEIIDQPSCLNPQHAQPLPISNPDGSPIEEMVFVKSGGKVLIGLHDMLETAFSLQVRDPCSKVRVLLDKRLSSSDLYCEYVSPEYPIGYTGNEIDYVLVYRSKSNPAQRHVVIVEFKRDFGEVQSGVFQLWFYIPWVVQVFSGCLPCFGDAEIHIHPLVVFTGFSTSGSRQRNRTVDVPCPTSLSMKRLDGKKVTCQVHEYSFWECVPTNMPQGNWFRSPVDFIDVTSQVRIRGQRYRLPIGVPLRHLERRGRRFLESFVK